MFIAPRLKSHYGCFLQNKTFLHVGRLLAMGIVQGSSGLPVFQYTSIFVGKKYFLWQLQGNMSLYMKSRNFWTRYMYIMYTVYSATFLRGLIFAVFVG